MLESGFAILPSYLTKLTPAIKEIMIMIFQNLKHNRKCFQKTICLGLTNKKLYSLLQLVTNPKHYDLLAGRRFKKCLAGLVLDTNHG